MDKFVKVIDNKKMLSIKALELFSIKAVEQVNSGKLTNNSSALRSVTVFHIIDLKIL